ncbi:hypothetical protein NLU13_2350 [Sarocladium strictum]|uniref:Zn(2)-C6 fungal-type domain-containing protein n=1 Tax=Sarocladium strictum TaxID=5046 RepID=A0AA39GSX2_SARSR|nr:hypothetical protein NLU13_2350 [Sarocladium strictum]
MTNAAATRPKQRTKAGCLVCRQKRKKCDEKLPVCDRCRRSGSQCQWPSSADLVDRRFASHSEFRHRKSTRSELPESALAITKPAFSLEAGAAHGVVSRDIETALDVHFDSNFSVLIIPPGGHPSFFDDWAPEVRQIRQGFKAFQYAALACSASHLHYKGSSPQMQELALTYYCHSLRQLGQMLASNSSGLEHNDGIIMCILSLCLHGATGRGTTADMQRHVDAVTKLLSLRIQASPSVIGRPFDRLSVECALHQAFLVSMAVWTDTKKQSLDMKFWHFTEGLLDQSNIYLHKPEGFRTPVVGIPASLLRVAMILRQQYRGLNQVDQVALNNVRPWVIFWERKSDQLTDGTIGAEPDMTEADRVRQDASHLYAIVASLMFMELSQKGRPMAGHPQPAYGCEWQIERAISLVVQHREDERWACFAMCDWPVYTLGLLVSNPDHIEIIRWDMQRRWELSKSGQSIRYWNDLEGIWSARTSPQTSPSEILVYPDDHSSYASSSCGTGDSPPEHQPSNLVVRIREATPCTAENVAAPLWHQHQFQGFQPAGILSVNAFGRT